MANRERGEMSFVADGVEYTLRLTTNACCELEDKSNRLLDDIIRGLNKGSVRDVRWFLWASLQAYHAAEIKEAVDAGNLIDRAGGLFAVVGALHRFVQQNADDRKRSGASDPPTAQGAAAGVDSTSTPVGAV